MRDRPLSPDTSDTIFVRYEDGGKTEVYRVWRPTGGLCGGTCRGTCSQPRSYKLKCPSRGAPWAWREVRVRALNHPAPG